jgi:hypothetical protein
MVNVRTDLRVPIEGEVKRSFSFAGFDFFKWFVSVEKPLIAIIATTVAMLETANPEYSVFIGVVSTLIYNAIKFFVKKYDTEYVVITE